MSLRYVTSDALRHYQVREGKGRVVKKVWRIGQSLWTRKRDFQRVERAILGNENRKREKKKFTKIRHQMMPLKNTNKN